MKTDFTSVDQYIATFSKNTQLLLENVCLTIVKKNQQWLKIYSMESLHTK